MESINVAGFMQEAGMLTQACTPDLKCKLNISSFLALPHLLDCPICTSNSMSIVLLLQMIGDGIGRGWLIYIRMSVGGGGDRKCYLNFFSCTFVFCSLMFYVPSCRCPERDSFCVCFIVVFFVFFVSGPFN